MSEQVCAACGTQLPPAAKYCPNCGVKVGEARESGTLPKPPQTCTVCGHVNAHDDAFCESCGARLPGRSIKEATGQKVPKQAGKKAGGKTGGAAKLQPWHYAMGIGLLVIVAAFIYMESQRAHGPSQPQMSPQQFSQSATSPPSKELLDAIKRLETTVKESPNDVGSRLMLANALHDAGTHDLQYMSRAIDEYTLYLKSQPADPNARVDLGICYFELGKTDSVRAPELFALAIQEMETALRTSPKHQPGAFNLGIVQLYAGNVAESNKWFKKATELNPESELGKRAKTILEQHSQPM